MKKEDAELNRLVPIVTAFWMLTNFTRFVRELGIMYSTIGSPLYSSYISWGETIFNATSSALTILLLYLTVWKKNRIALFSLLGLLAAFTVFCIVATDMYAAIYTFFRILLLSLLLLLRKDGVSAWKVICSKDDIEETE